MKAPKFSYVRAESVEHALRLLDEHGEEARILAGGQSLMPTLNMRLSQPRLLIDINRLDALAGICAARRPGAHRRADPPRRGGRLPDRRRAPAADRGGHAACRPCRRAQSRHVRRQHRARRSGGRDAGLRAGARRDACRRRAPAAGARSRRRTTSKASTRRRASPTSCWSRRSFRCRRPDCVSVFMELARRHGDFAIAGVAFHLEIDGRRGDGRAPRLLRQRGQADARAQGARGHPRQAARRRACARRRLQRWRTT